MKQRITIKQLKELNKKGREKLNTWITGVQFDDRLLRHSVLQLLSIGQMIEFINEKYLYWGIYPRWSRSERCSECNSGWKISKDEKPLFIVWADIMEYKEPQEIWAGKDELCDALWEAVKNCLNKSGPN